MPTYIVEVDLGTETFTVEAEDAEAAWQTAFDEWESTAQDTFASATCYVREVS